MPRRVVAKQPDPQSEEQTVSDSAPKKNTKRPKPERRLTALNKKMESPSEPSVIAAATPQPQLTPPAPPKPHAPTPTDRDIQAGMEKGALIAAFGRPTLRTTAVDRDRLMETFVYVNNERETATFATLRDGKVVSAQTTIY